MKAYDVNVAGMGKYPKTIRATIAQHYRYKDCYGLFSISSGVLGHAARLRGWGRGCDIVEMGVLD